MTGPAQTQIGDDGQLVFWTFDEEPEHGSGKETRADLRGRESYEKSVTDFDLSAAVDSGEREGYEAVHDQPGPYIRSNLPADVKADLRRLLAAILVADYGQGIPMKRAVSEPGVTCPDQRNPSGPASGEGRDDR